MHVSEEARCRGPGLAWFCEAGWMHCQNNIGGGFFGSEMDIQYTGSSSGGHSCSQQERVTSCALCKADLCMSFTQHLDIPHLPGWWIILAKECSLTQILTNVCSKSEINKAIFFFNSAWENLKQKKVHFCFCWVYIYYHICVWSEQRLSSDVSQVSDSTRATSIFFFFCTTSKILFKFSPNSPCFHSSKIDKVLKTKTSVTFFQNLSLYFTMSRSV